MTLPQLDAPGTGIAITDLSKTFRSSGRTVQALDGVTLNTPRGSFISLLGPSGCGKSTVLRMLAGLETPGSGQIQVNGSTVAPGKRAPGMGIAFQDAALLPWRSVRSNIRLPLEIQGTKDEDTVDHLINLVGLSG
ncbi:MAG: ATP-binding cassette domain-containing protein, partial [Mycetocola sp.]